MSQLKITVCPTCGSRKIRRVARDIQSRLQGSSFIARGIEIDEFPHCGERLFSPDAIREIDAQRPKAKRTASHRKTA